MTTSDVLRRHRLGAAGSLLSLALLRLQDVPAGSRHRWLRAIKDLPRRPKSPYSVARPCRASPTRIMFRCLLWPRQIICHHPIAFWSDRL